MTASCFLDLCSVERDVLPKAEFLYDIDFSYDALQYHEVSPQTSRTEAHIKLLKNALFEVFSTFKFNHYRMGDIYRKTWKIYRRLFNEFIHSRRNGIPTHTFWVSEKKLYNIIFLLQDCCKTQDCYKFIVTTIYGTGDYVCCYDDKNKIFFNNNGIIKSENIITVTIKLGTINLVFYLDQENDDTQITAEEIRKKYFCFECDNAFNVVTRSYTWEYIPDSIYNTPSSAPIFNINLCNKCYRKTCPDYIVKGYSWIEAYDDLSNNYKKQ